MAKEKKKPGRSKERSMEKKRRSREEKEQNRQRLRDPAPRDRQRQSLQRSESRSTGDQGRRRKGSSAEHLEPAGLPHKGTVPLKRIHDFEGERVGGIGG
jgi:hypothetical protein